MTQTPVGGSNPSVGSIAAVSGSSGPAPQLKPEKQKAVVPTSNAFDLDQHVEAMDVLITKSSNSKT